MLWETNDDFSFDEKNDTSESWIAKRSTEWEELMSKYQMPLSIAKSNEKWVLMERIFEL